MHDVPKTCALEHETCNVVVSGIRKQTDFVYGAVIASSRGKFALCNKTKRECEMRVRNMHFRAGPDAVVDFAWTAAGVGFQGMEGTILLTIIVHLDGD